MVTLNVSGDGTNLRVVDASIPVEIGAVEHLRDFSVAELAGLLKNRRRNQ
jgi:hypothetical protein